MGPPLKPEQDPLADYTPEWRKAGGGTAVADDPLTDYQPNWRGKGTGLFGTAARLAAGAATPGALRPLSDETVTPRKQSSLESALTLARGGPPALAAEQAPYRRPLTDEEQTERTLDQASPEALAHPNILAAAGTGGAVAKEAGYLAATKGAGEGAEAGLGVLSEAERAAFPRVARALDEIAGRSTLFSRGAGAVSSGAKAAAASVPFAIARETAEGTPAEEIPGKLPLYAAPALVGGGLFGAAGAPRISPSRVMAPAGLMNEAVAANPGSSAFRVLGLDARTATAEDVQAAWRERVRDVHPDVNPSPEAAGLARRYNVARDDALSALRGRVAQTPPEAPPAASAPVSRAPEARPTEQAPRAPEEAPEAAAEAVTPSAAPQPPAGLRDKLEELGVDPAVIEHIVTGQRPVPEVKGQIEPFAARTPEELRFPGDPLADYTPDWKHPAAGEAHDDSAIQEGLFGTPTLQGKEQSELLPETAGVPTAKMGNGKISPEEMSRVRREGGEPEGERPADLLAGAGAAETGTPPSPAEEVRAGTEPAPAEAAPPREKRTRKPSYAVEGSNPKYAKVSNEDLEDRYLELVERGEASSKTMQDGIMPWSREDPNMDISAPGTTKRTGILWGGKKGSSGRAKGALDVAGRLMDEVAAEMKVRGLDTDGVLERAEERRALKGDTEVPDYEELARGQKSGFGPRLRSQVIEELIKAGHPEAHVRSLDDRKLAELAVDSETLSPEQETRLMDVIFKSPEMGAVRIPGSAGGKPPGGLRDAFRKILYPEARGPEAKTAARLLRTRIGEYRRALAVNNEALKSARKDVPSLDTPEGIEWYDRAEGGKGQVSPKLQAANDIVRQRYGEALKAVQDLGTGKLADPIENYLSHIWKDPAKAKQVMREFASKKPMQGSKSFLRERKIPTLAEGMQLGLEPVTKNPIDLQLLKMREMWKYVMAQRFLSDAKEQGLAQFLRIGKSAPDGWKRIDDTTFAVWGRNDAGELILRGHYWMPEQAAQIVNNYLSPGLRGNALFDSYMAVGNSLNQFQLGASGFHAGFSTFTGTVSRVANGIGKLRTGRSPFQRPSAAGVKGGAIGATVGGLAGGPGGAAAGSLLGSTAGRLLADGLALKASYLKPGTGGVLEQRIADMLERAGGQHVMDPTYKNDALASLKEAASRGNLPKMLANTAALVLEKLAWPTMEYYVPLIKLGAFSQLARSEMERLGPLATSDKVDEAMQGIWHSIDNRFGQVSYDTRFWNNAVKHALMGTVRAVGWDAGSVDELVGGLNDALKGKPSLRLDFLLALPLATAFINILIQYALTGEGPTGIQDVFEPRDGTKDSLGNANRLTPATYMKDIIAFGRHPIMTTEHKLHPVLDFFSSLLHNRDFYGDQIRNPHDPLSQQLGQVGQYLLKEFTPISVRNVQEQGKRDETGLRKWLPSIGVTPASREAVRTKAQNLMYDFLGERRTQGATPEEAAKRDARREAVGSVRAGQSVDASKLADEGLNHRQVKGIFQRGKENPLVGSFKQLTADEAQQVYNLGNPEEQRLWGRILHTKLQNRGR